MGTRSATQIQSHAQKYFLRLEKQNKNKKSIHDFTLEELSEIIDAEARQRIQEECERQLALFNEKKNNKQNKRRSSSSRTRAKENISDTEIKQGSPTDFAKSPSPSSDIMSMSSEGTNKKRASVANDVGNDDDTRNPKNRKVKREEDNRNEEAFNASIYHQISQQYMHGPQMQAFGYQQPIYQHLGIRAMSNDNRMAPTGFHNMTSLYNPHVAMLYHTQQEQQHQLPQHRYPPLIFNPPCHQSDTKYHDANDNDGDDDNDHVDNDVNRFEKYEEDSSEQRNEDNHSNDIDNLLPMDSQDINTNDLIIKTLGHAKSDNVIPANGNSVSFTSFMGYPSQWAMDNSNQQRPALSLFPSENSNSTFFKRRLFSDTTSQDDSTFGFTKNREAPM